MFFGSQTLPETRAYTQGTETPAQIAARAGTYRVGGQDVLKTDLVVSDGAGWKFREARMAGVAGLLLTASANGTFEEHTLLSDAYSTDGSNRIPGPTEARIPGISQTYTVIFNAPRLAHETRRVVTQSYDGQQTVQVTSSTWGYTTGAERFNQLGQVSADDLANYVDPSRKPSGTPPSPDHQVRRGLLKTYTQQASLTSLQNWTDDETTTGITSEFLIRRQQTLLQRQTTTTHTVTGEGNVVDSVNSLRYVYTTRDMEATDPRFLQTDYLAQGNPVFADNFKQANGKFRWDNLLLSATSGTQTALLPWGGTQAVTGAYSSVQGIDFSQSFSTVETTYRIQNNRAVEDRTVTRGEQRSAAGEVNHSLSAVRYVYSKVGDDQSLYARTNYATDHGTRFFDAGGRMKVSGLLREVVEEAATLTHNWNSDSDTTDAFETLAGTGQLTLTMDLFGNLTASVTQSLGADHATSSHRIIDGRDVIESAWTVARSLGADGTTTRSVGFQEFFYSGGENPHGTITIGGSSRSSCRMGTCGAACSSARGSTTSPSRPATRSGRWGPPP